MKSPNLGVWSAYSTCVKPETVVLFMRKLFVLGPRNKQMTTFIFKVNISMCVLTSIKLDKCLYHMMQSGTKTLIFPLLFHCYFVLSSGNLPVIPNMYTMAAEARNVSMEPNRFNSVIIYHEQNFLTY